MDDAAQPAPGIPARAFGDPLDALDSDLSAVASGDLAAFERVYDAASPHAYGVSLRVCRDPELAADITQEAMTEVWRKAENFAPERGRAIAWIVMIAHRRAVDHVRSEQAHRDRLQREGRLEAAVSRGGVDQPEEVADRAYREWEAARVRAGMRQLTDLQREAITLAFYDGFTHREVAAELEIPLGTAKSRLRDGLARLRDAWEVQR